MTNYKKGDLVHIPQSVVLIDCDPANGESQLTIPLRIKETTAPSLGIVTDFNDYGDYLRVFYEGDEWAVKSASVYSLGGKND